MNLITKLAYNALTKTIQTILPGGASIVLPIPEEVVSASAACTGAITTAAVWKAVKIGRVVTLTLPVTTGTAAAQTEFSYGVVLPVAFRPIQNLTAPVDVFDNGARQLQAGMIFITASSGNIQVYRSFNATSAFTAAATAGINESKTISYVV